MFSAIKFFKSIPIILMGSFLLISCGPVTPKLPGVGQSKKKWEVKASKDYVWTIVDSKIDNNIYAFQRGGGIFGKPKFSKIDSQSGAILNELNPFFNTLNAFQTITALGIEFFNKENQVVAYKNGEKLYSIPIADSLELSFYQLDQEKNLLFLWLDNEELLANDLLTGKPVWKSKLPDDFGKFIKIATLKNNNILLIFDENLLELDGTSGKLVKNIEYDLDIALIPLTSPLGVLGKRILPAIFGGPYFDPDGRTMYITSDGIAAIDMVEGKQLWEKEMDVTSGEFSAIYMAEIMGTSAFSSIELTVITPLILDENRILVNDVDGEILCLNKKTGEKIWESEEEEPVDELKKIDEGIFVKLGGVSVTVDGVEGDGPFGFKILDEKTGKEIKKFTSDDPILQVFKVNDSTFWVGTKEIFEIDSKFEKKSTFDFSKTYKADDIISVAQVQNGIEFLLFTANTVYRFDPTTNKVQYKTALGADYYSYSNLALKDDTRVFKAVTKNSEILYSMNEKTGKINYFKQIGETVDVPLQDEDEMVLFGFEILPEQNLFTLIEQYQNPVRKGDTLSGYMLFEESDTTHALNISHETTVTPKD